jgi:hypothetical protein
VIATLAISNTQIQPMVRCGSVPLGAANWTRPSVNAPIGMKRYRGRGIQQWRKAHGGRSHKISALNGTREAGYKNR